MRLLSPQGIFKLIVGVVLIATISILAKYSKDHSPNRGDAKLKEIESMYSQLPIYPDFQEVAHNFSSKDVSVMTGKSYMSSAKYADIRSFYSDRLSASGWQLTNERNMKDWWRDFGGRQLTFRKGQYSIVIEYRGDKKPNPDWNYVIDFEWHDT
ncbi:MAG TPA: hypothetical protein DC047_11605 [Blastocatellia bacterium]|nr:hypothetical protein [Blastocatellia bacterium]